MIGRMVFKAFRMNGVREQLYPICRRTQDIREFRTIRKTLSRYCRTCRKAGKICSDLLARRSI